MLLLDTLQLQIFVYYVFCAHPEQFRLLPWEALGGTQPTTKMWSLFQGTSEGRDFSTSLLYNTLEFGKLSKKIKTVVSNQSEEIEAVSSLSQQKSQGSLDAPRKTVSTLITYVYVPCACFKSGDTEWISLHCWKILTKCWLIDLTKTAFSIKKQEKMFT